MMAIKLTSKNPTMENFDFLTELILNGPEKEVEKQARHELVSLLHTAAYLKDVDQEAHQITEMWKSVKRLFR